MADNTTLNPGVGGDVIRTLDRGVLGKTELVLPDNLNALGYQQVTTSIATGLTVPAGAKMAIVTPEGQSVRWRDDGTLPTASVGYPLSVGSELTYDARQLTSVQFIQTASSATLSVSYYGI